MSKSKGPVDPDLVPPTDESPPYERRELAPSTDEYEQEPQEEQAGPEPEHEHAYDENGQPYDHGEQAYDENGQPYEQAYAEQAYEQQEAQPYEEEHQQGPVYDDSQTAAYDPQAYETAPMTGPPHLLQHHMQQHAQQMQVQMPPLPPPQALAQQGIVHQGHQGPPSQGGPYRVHYDPNAFMPARGVPIPRPLLGSAIAVYGVLLWSFVIAGQFATSWISGAPMDQGLAAFIILACTIGAWIVAARRSRDAMPTTTTAKFVGRIIGMGALAFLAFLFTIMGATLLGEASSGSGHDFLIAFLLVVIAALAAGFGPRLTHPLRPAPSHGMRFAVVLVWIAGAIATFVAGAELATSG